MPLPAHYPSDLGFVCMSIVSDHFHLIYISNESMLSAPVLMKCPAHYTQRHEEIVRDVIFCLLLYTTCRYFVSMHSCSRIIHYDLCIIKGSW